jgi:hypothetical protein
MRDPSYRTSHRRLANINPRSQAHVAQYLLSKFCWDEWHPFLPTFRRAIDVAKFPLRDRKATLVPVFGVVRQSGDRRTIHADQPDLHYLAARDTPMDRESCTPRATA